MDIGAQLRAARETKGLSISTLAQRTRVPARTLAAIELNDQSSLPPHPFGRGFVRTYADEVDLDPDRLVRDYFAQFPAQPAPVPGARDAPEPSWQPASRWMGMGTAVAILLVVVAAAVVLGRRSDSAVEPDAVGTTGASPATSAPTAAAPQPIAQPDSVAPSAAVAAPAARPSQSGAQSGAITVVLSMSRPCWVAATVDGRRTIYRILQPGDRQTLVGQRDIAIRFGDAGGVTWTINGRDAGSPGSPGVGGVVRDVRITAENAATAR
jgi:cytoskeletal protein RodZ